MIPLISAWNLDRWEDDCRCQVQEVIEKSIFRFWTLFFEQSTGYNTCFRETDVCRRHTHRNPRGLRFYEIVEYGTNYFGSHDADAVLPWDKIRKIPFSPALTTGRNTLPARSKKETEDLGGVLSGLHRRINTATNFTQWCSPIITRTHLRLISLIGTCRYLVFFNLDTLEQIFFFYE